MNTAGVLLITGLSVGAVAALWLVDKEVELRLDREFSAEEVTAVHLSNINGSVVVVASDRSSIRVRAVKRAKSLSRRKATQKLEEIEVATAEHDGVIEIRTRAPRSDWKEWFHGGLLRVGVDYVLEVPADVHLEIETVNGKVEVAGSEAPVRARTVNGKISILRSRGSLDAGTTNGFILVQVAELDPDQAVKLSTVNGGITLELAPDQGGDLEASTVLGRVRTDPPGEFSVRSWRKVRGELDGGGGTIRLEAVNGSIRIRGG